MTQRNDCPERFDIRVHRPRMTVAQLRSRYRSKEGRSSRPRARANPPGGGASGASDRRAKAHLPDSFCRFLLYNALAEARNTVPVALPAASCVGMTSIPGIRSYWDYSKESIAGSRALMLEFEDSDGSSDCNRLTTVRVGKLPDPHRPDRLVASQDASPESGQPSRSREEHDERRMWLRQAVAASSGSEVDHRWTAESGELGSSSSWLFPVAHP
jgi:hypothetical protein